MQFHKNSHNDTLQPHHELFNIYAGGGKRLILSALYAFISIFFLLVSCGKKTVTYTPDEQKHTENNKNIGTSEEGEAMSLLLRDYD